MTPYPSMAPLDQYLMDQNSEVALARSAAPESISRDAEVWFLDATVTKARLREQTVSCAWWNVLDCSGGMQEEDERDVMQDENNGN